VPFFYLVHNPHTLDLLAEEICRTFQDVEEIHHSPTLNSCVYLRAVIDEAMRLSPPVGGILPREVLPGGIDIDGMHIPAGIIVGTPHYALHHNADYFPNPFSFQPERWIAESHPHNTEDSVALAQSAFSPFSIGPRGCIGKGIAYMELMTTLARVVLMYEMRKVKGTNVGEGSMDNNIGRQRLEEYQLKDCFTSMKDGPMVEFRERKVVN